MESTKDTIIRKLPGKGRLLFLRMTTMPLQRLLKTMQVTFRLELFLRLNIMIFVKIRICINIRSLSITSEIELMELTNHSS